MSPAQVPVVDPTGLCPVHYLYIRIDPADVLPFAWVCGFALYKYCAIIEQALLGFPAPSCAKSAKGCRHS